MKRITLVVTVFAILFLSSHVQAQSKTGTDYFEGKWKVLLKALPDGDTRMFFVLEKKDSTLTGLVQDSTGTLVSKIDKVEISDSVATIYFNARGYDVTLTMNKKGDDHIIGSLMGMFDAEGDRVKVVK